MTATQPENLVNIVAGDPTDEELAARGAVIIAIGGLALGLAGGYATARAIAQFIFGVSAFDLFAFLTVPLALAAALAAAALLPAHRATRTDPLTALRHE